MLDDVGACVVLDRCGKCMQRPAVHGITEVSAEIEWFVRTFDTLPHTKLQRRGEAIVRVTFRSRCHLKTRGCIHFLSVRVVSF